MNRNTELFLKRQKAFCDEYNMLSPGDTVIVGLSGGADSVCLLHSLNFLKCELSLNLTAVHINHGIRGDEAKRDAEFSRNICKNLGIPFELFEYDCPGIAEKSGESVEECGRRLRYEAFSETAKKHGAQKIATAHNANDNAETVLFNITRGSALKGASGIPPVRGNIIRPILFASRTEIEDFCKCNSLEYITDSTNLSDDYTRNRIRHRVLPELLALNPSGIEAFERFSRAAAVTSDYLNLEAKKAINDSKLSKNEYDRRKLLKLHPAVLNEVLFLLIRDFCGVSPSFERISEASDVIKRGGKVQLFSDCFFKTTEIGVVFYNISPKENREKPSWVSLDDIAFDGNFGEFHVKIEKYTNSSKKINRFVLDNLIDYDKIVGIPVLRTRAEGDTFSFSKRKVTKSLKKLFNEAKIPPEERAFIPLISDDRGVVWIKGFGTNARCKPTAESENLIIAEGERL